jgi:hypothetical protein
MVTLPGMGASVTQIALLDAMVTDKETETFTSRWEDLASAGLFDNFSIQETPKLEIWKHLDNRKEEIVPLRPLAG